MSLSHLTASHLRKASRLIKKKESFLAKVRKIEFELDAFALFGSLPGKIAVTPKVPRKRRKLSAAARAKIAAGQKKRWAKVKEGKP